MVQSMKSGLLESGPIKRLAQLGEVQLGRFHCIYYIFKIHGTLKPRLHGKKN